VDENSFQKHYKELNVPMKRLIGIIETLLHKWGYQYATVPINISYNFITSRNDILEVWRLSQNLNLRR